MNLNQSHIGSLVTFAYDSPNSHDAAPEVLVLHHSWEGLIHGINFNYLTKEELDFVKSVINEDYAAEAIKQYPGIGVEIDRMKTNLLTLQITSPGMFYNKFIKNFIKKYGSYRLYKPEYVRSLRTMISSEVMRGLKPGLVFDKYKVQIQAQKPETAAQKAANQQVVQQPNKQNPLASVPNPVRDQSEFFRNLGKNK